MVFGEVIKTCTSKKGKLVTFRYLHPRDLDDMLRYVNQLIDEDTFIGIYGKKLTRLEESEFLTQELKDMKAGIKSHIVVEVDGRYAGSAQIRPQELRRKKHGADIGMSLAKDSRDQGIGTELLTVLIQEARRMGFRLLTLGCFENNDIALHVYRKMGFKIAGIIPESIHYKESYVGEVIMYLPLGPKS